MVTVDKQFCMVGDLACWTFCVTYVDGTPSPTVLKPGEQREKVDYKAVLDEYTFGVFSKLREIRKALATEDAVPAYAVFTDAELAEISKLHQIDEKTLLTLKGVGSARVEKYGRKLSQRYNEHPIVAEQ